MASSNGDQKKVAINGDTSGWNPTAQDEIILILASNGGLKRIRNTLKQRLDEKGWSEDLRNYCTALFRSGAAVTYDDALTIIMRRIHAGEADPDGVDDGVPAPNLSIPSDVQHAGADAVKKELLPIVEQKKNVAEDLVGTPSRSPVEDVSDNENTVGQAGRAVSIASDGDSLGRSSTDGSGDSAGAPVWNRGSDGPASLESQI